MPRAVTLALSLLTLFALQSTQAIAKSSVWKISKGDHHIFLGGTIHVLASTDHPLPAEFDQAYAQSKTLFFETDIQASSSPRAQRLLLQALSYQDERTLKSTIAPKTYDDLSAFMRSRGMPIETFDKFTPAGISLTLATMEYQRLGMQPQYGVDAHYTARAQQDKKTMEALETIEAQIDFIKHMADGQEDDMVAYALRDMGRAGNMITQLKESWRIGAVERSEALLIEELKNDFPGVYQRLILDRNDAWMVKLEKLFDSRETEFVLVGTLHLVGKDGLLTQFKSRGYQIQQM